VVLNHALVVVGYGVDETTGLAFWRCKNSWGKEWGEGGYVRIRRRQGGREGGGTDPGVCGVALAPSVPVGAYGGNVTAWLQARRKEEGKGGREEVVKKKDDDGDSTGGGGGGGGGGGSGGGTTDPVEPFASVLPEWAQRVLVGVGGTMLLLVCAVYFYGRPVVSSTPPTTAAAAAVAVASAAAAAGAGGGYQPVWNGRGEGGREGEGEEAALRGGGGEESKYGSV